MPVYIAYRDLKRHHFENSLMGGPPANTDFRLANVRDDIYLLTRDGRNYAVSKERAERFAGEVLDRCTGEHSGSFPMVPSLNGRETAAVIEKTEGIKTCWYDMDDQVLLGMLEALQAESGEPMDEKALMNYCYPNAVLPEGDFELDTVCHQIYHKPLNLPPGLIPFSQLDRKTSSFRVRKGGADLELRKENTLETYDVPAELISEVKAQVRELCGDPVGAYVEDGKWEAFVRFGKEEERIFTEPEKTLALLKTIASKCSLKEKREVHIPAGGAWMGNINIIYEPAPQQAEPADGSSCPMCGAPRTGGKFCTECGYKF